MEEEGGGRRSKSYVMSRGGSIMSHGGYIRSPGGHIRSHWALQEDSGHLRKKVFNFICVLPTKVARDGPGLTRERRDDDYSP